MARNEALRRSLRAAVRGRPRRRLHRDGRRRARRQTIAANPHLKLMFGFASETAEHDVRPFEPSASSIRRRATASSSGSQRDGAVTDYLLRLRRADETPMWVEVTGARRAAAATAAARRGARPRRQRAQEARRRDARHLPPAAAGREDGGARPDDLRRRARAEQPARHDPQLGRAAVAAAALDDHDPPRPRDDPQRVGARRATSSATC